MTTGPRTTAAGVGLEPRFADRSANIWIGCPLRALPFHRVNSTTALAVKAVARIGRKIATGIQYQKAERARAFGSLRSRSDVHGWATIRNGPRSREYLLTIDST
jgi:hypothetical protein